MIFVIEKNAKLNWATKYQIMSFRHTYQILDFINAIDRLIIFLMKPLFVTFSDLTQMEWPAYNSTIFTLYLEAMTKQSNYGILQFVKVNFI